MLTSLPHLRLAGLEVEFGSITKRLRDEVALYGNDAAQIERIARTVGLESRSVAADGVTALDLCEKAAQRLLEKLAVDPSSIDAVVFVTQTPDHSQPANANLLHGRLGLSKSAIAFDLSQGCSGFIYGLHYAGMLCAHGGAARVLLCCGDTLSRLVNPRDRSVAPLFGDAGAAVLIERTGEATTWHFSLGSDGTGAKTICVPAGGARQPLSVGESLKDVIDGEGNVRNASNLVMNGPEVFNFSLREPASAVQQVMSAAGWNVDNCDALVLHQANRFIVQTIGKRLGFPDSKVPIASLAAHGNLSSASIPGALATEVAPLLASGRRKLVLCGFGVGLSWGAVTLEAGPF